MYAESGLPSPYLANLSHQVQQFDESSFSVMPNASLASTISDYNPGGEPLAGVDPMTGAISMLACGDDVITPQSLTVSDIESSIKSGHLLSEVFYECRKDLLAKEGNETPLSDVFSIETPTDKSNNENFTVDENILASANGIFHKSISLTYSRSMDQFVHEAATTTTTTQGSTFQDFHCLEFGAAYGMRRAFSEGDIKVDFFYFFLYYYFFLSNLITFSCMILSTREYRESALLKIAWKSYRDTGLRSPSEILAKNSSMLAGRLLPTANLGYAEGSPRPKKSNVPRRDDIIISFYALLTT